MGKEKREYKVEIDVSGPKPVPKLKGIGSNDRIEFDKTKNNMKKVDHYRIRFELDDPSTTNLRFIKDYGEVMWCQPGNTCPSSGTMPGVFWVDEVDKDGEWVDVINMDMIPQTFGFALNLADKNIANPTPADYVTLDPIGENKNGGSAGSDFTVSAFAAVTIGAAAGLATFAAARLLLSA